MWRWVLTHTVVRAYFADSYLGERAMLTIVLATHNGAEWLPLTLESFTKLRAPQGGHKIVIVENGSTDNSREILDAFKGRLNLSVLHREIANKGAALNAAIPEFEGDLIVLTDDDVIVDPGWLIELRKAADEQLDFDVFGACIKPYWPIEPPEWIFRLVRLGSTYGLTSPDLEAGAVNPGLVWGANMAVRRTIFQEGHRYNEDFGPQIGQYRMGGETEFTRRLANLGHKAWFVPEAQIEHIIRLNQLKPRWIIKRAYRQGRCDFWHQNDPALAIENTEYHPVVSCIFGVPRWKYRVLIVSAIKLVMAKVRGDFDSWFTASWDYSNMRGDLVESLSDQGRCLRRNIDKSS
jgi:glycosyltransferase involved in cell wall biosynthesis